MDARLGELLALATDAFAKHGDSTVWFVVHEVDANRAVIDHDEGPDVWNLESCSGFSIQVGDRRLGPSIRATSGNETAMEAWREIAQACGAWLLATGSVDYSPLPSPIARWQIELLKLPTNHRQYRKSAWFCNAFGANVVMLRLIAAGDSGPTPAIKQADAKAASSATGACDGGPLKADESLRLGYQDPDNYWRNVWLYEQKDAGEKNAAILTKLAQISRERNFEVLETENAMRSAIDSIAQYQRWPPIKGRPGRPRASDL